MAINTKHSIILLILSVLFGHTYGQRFFCELYVGGGIAEHVIKLSEEGLTCINLNNATDDSKEILLHVDWNEIDGKKYRNLQDYISARVKIIDSLAQVPRQIADIHLYRLLVIREPWYRSFYLIKEYKYMSEIDTITILLNDLIPPKHRSDFQMPEE